ncbi:MAG: hypothetical protein FIA99_14015 [Ruminiclostridium sp.]|nr:hypothetical protein [Ruminiclostridium sp.]
MHDSISTGSTSYKALLSVKAFADAMIRFGRDTYGKKTPLFAGQMNIGNLRIPEGIPGDAGVYPDNREVAGTSPQCQNLLFDLGLLDVLKRLTVISGDTAYESARREYLEYFFNSCLHPDSGYIPWGEHVGYDIVNDRIKQGGYKGQHEVKGVVIPWDDFWAVSPEAARHEIEVAFKNHICDESTFAFQRHAEMNGKSNLGMGSTSIADSGGVYLYAWTWLYKKTGEIKFLNWAKAIENLFWNRRSAETGLFNTCESRPEEMWYSDMLHFAALLLGASVMLGEEGETFKQHGISHIKTFYKYSYDHDKKSFHDTLDIITGKPVVGLSRHCPPNSSEAYIQAYTRREFLPLWDMPQNAMNVVSVAVSSAAAYTFVQDESILELFDKAISLLKIDEAVKERNSIISGNAAGIILALVHTFRLTRNREYFRLATLMAEYVLKNNFRNGLFSTGMSEYIDYYSARLGSADLASALLAYWTEENRPDLQLPPIRDVYGTMPW